ncbi:hypothetical protein T11_2616 [Trichinella zimbabwensis]|uniref:Uncharacterized protein n=1 Tax=Trichinella zimbabwensis TaxID=268475 RepID=A0A0V1GEC1_9BILA|nr:hypothetical protein T11_2616 [Trichinella zimbabwensis]
MQRLNEAVRERKRQVDCTNEDKLMEIKVAS